MGKKLPIKVFVFEKIAFQLAPWICLYYEEKTCDHQSMCSQTVRRFCILLRETFFGSFTFTLIKKFTKDALAQISTVFGPVYYVAFEKVFRNGTF